MIQRRALRRIAAWGVLTTSALIILSAKPALAQVGPEESAKQVKPAAGLEATLWASEPMVVNPTNMEVDSRGRVWVSEGLNYRMTHKNSNFKRIEDADKIKILEDTDGDGKADKVTVFADKIFPIPMGLAVEERYGLDGKYQGCKVYVGNSPDLLVLEDTDGDDKADKRYALLTGFGGVDSDHGVHGMVLGLDGKLYFTHGDGCCSFEQSTGRHDAKNFDVTDKSGRHVSSNQLANTLRVNRDGTQFEIIADRQRNNYETCLNSFGNIFTSDNDDDGNRGSRVIWVMDGGKYGYRTPGSPRHWGEEVPGNVPKLVGTGNGSPCGIMVYEGNLLPKEYFGGLFEADAGTRQINFFPISRHGASFRTDYKVLLGSDDPWFRPVDMTAAPDGSVFVADWYDSGVGGHAFRDQSTGRIYRVAPKGAKTKRVNYNFATVPGLIEALKSPVVATVDAARRSLIARMDDPKPEVGNPIIKALGDFCFNDDQPAYRARGLWVLTAKVPSFATAFLADKNSDPRIREEAVRILGRDESRNGKVEFTRDVPDAPPPGVRLLHLNIENDPDAGVRRELILALRDVTSEQAPGVENTLRTLAQSWDGQDRWYLEALGLALEKRDSAFLASLFDGKLFGDLNLDLAGKDGLVALPPYFPVDRNEAYIAVGTKDLPANALSKNLGLAWRLHGREALPLLVKILPTLEAPELQQAADDVLAQMRDPKTATMLAELALKSTDTARKRQILGTLGRRLDVAWRNAQRAPEVVRLAESSFKEFALLPEAVKLAGATADPRYLAALMPLARAPELSEELKVAAVEAIARIGDDSVKPFLLGLIEDNKDKGASWPAAEAAVRSLARIGDPRDRLLAMIQDNAYPLGLRREALRTFAVLNDGGARLLELSKSGKLPADLKTEASTVLSTHVDRRVRDQALSQLPLPKTRGGKPLPSFYDMVRREGKAENGREIFFRTTTNTCAGCHRVQGRGQWIGPDLSTIGTKYGRDELLRSILNPSMSIGYNFRSLTVALKDGRTLTGLPVEDGPERLVLKTADARRIALTPTEVEDRMASDISLMPEGLAETLTDQELADLLSFLATLKQPVSIVGQYHVVGPLVETEGNPAINPTAKVDLRTTLPSSNGQKLAWRRLDANAESVVDLSSIVGNDSTKVAYVFAPIVSPAGQRARIVIDTKADVKAWLNGKPLSLATSDDQNRVANVDLPQGASEFLIRLSGGVNAMLVTTIVADKPLSFQPSETKVSTR